MKEKRRKVKIPKEFTHGGVTYETTYAKFPKPSVCGECVKDNDKKTVCPTPCCIRCVFFDTCEHDGIGTPAEQYGCAPDLIWKTKNTKNTEL